MRLRRARDLNQCTLAAIDTDIGKVHDLYFDDRWTIRYIVVATGELGTGHKVLISPLKLRHPTWTPLHLRVNLTSEQVEHSPETTPQTHAQQALQSVREVAGYHINATDGEIGHLEDFLFDDQAWQIRYAVVDTKNWWPGKKVLLTRHSIHDVNPTNHEIDATVSRQTVRNSPVWNPNQPISREYELRLHQHYGYPPYWTREISG